MTVPEKSFLVYKLQFYCESCCIEKIKKHQKTHIKQHVPKYIKSYTGGTNKKTSLAVRNATKRSSIAEHLVNNLMYGVSII